MAIALLETERLTLRKPIPSDWDAFYAFTQSDRSKGIGGPYAHGYAWRMFAAEIGHWAIRNFGMFIVTLKGQNKPLGLIGPWYPDDWPETEIGWMMFEGSEGKGFAFEAAKRIVRHAWEDLKWDTIVSYIDADNARSIALAERLGANHDPAAIVPKPDNPCLVYRHPKPKELL